MTEQGKVGNRKSREVEKKGEKETARSREKSEATPVANEGKESDENL